MNSKKLMIIIVLVLITAGETWYIRNQQDQIENLNFRIMSLKYQNSVLSSRCNVLESNISSVLGELEGEIKELKLEYSQLDTEYEALLFDFNNMVYEFEKLKRNNDKLENEFEIYVAQFKHLQDNINSRIGIDGNLSKFVTPMDPEVVDLMFKITSGYEDPNSFDELWEDYEDIFDWITATISYSTDSPYPYLYSDPSYPVRWLEHSVRFPNETLADQTGDCEDQAILLLSTMIAHNNRFAKWCISIKWDVDGHVAVAIPVSGGRLVIIDPTGNYHSGTVSNFLSEPVEEAIENWLHRWDEPSIHIDSVFDDGFFKGFESTEEFYEWFESNYNH